MVVIMSKILILFYMGLFLGGCASNHLKNTNETKVEKHLSPEEIEKLNQETLKKVSQRLEELSIAAKASGPDKVQFLASDFYLKASAALMEGDYQTANLIFEQLEKLVPDDIYIKKKYAVSLVRTGKLDEAKKMLEVVYEKSGKDDENSALLLGGLYASLGDVSSSQRIYKEVLARNPKNEEACIFLGKSYALDKKTKKAVSLLKSCENRSPKKGIFSYYIGKIYSNKKQFLTAQKYFQKAVKKEPEFHDAVMALGVVLEERGHPKKAEKVYKDYINDNPQAADILARLVELLFTQEKFDEVVDYAERLSDLDPSDLNLRVKLGILYTDTQRFDKAVKTFEDLLEFSPGNDKLLYYLGAIHQETKEFESALEAYSQIPTQSALYHDSALQMAHILSAMALISEEKEKRFLSYIDKKINELDQFKFEFSMIKATYLDSANNMAHAIEVLEAVQSDKSFSTDHKFYLASLYEKEEQFKEATTLIQSILKSEPENAHALNFLGYSLLERGIEFDQAYKYISQAINIMPEDGYIRDSLGWYFFKIGKVKEALKELKKAAAKVPDDISINRHLAVVYSTLKNFKKAQSYIKKAIAEVKSEEEKEELTEILKELEKNRLPASFE